MPRATLAAQKLHVSLPRQLFFTLWLDAGDERQLELPEVSRVMTLAAEGFPCESLRTNAFLWTNEQSEARVWS